MRKLIIRPGAIGDIIASLPALQKLADEETEIWVPTATVPLIRFCSRVQAISSTSLDLFELPGMAPPSLWRRLRSFETIYSWYGSNRPEFRRAVADFPFQFYPALPPPRNLLPAASYFMDQIGAFDPKNPPIPSLPIKRTTGGYAVIHPFSGSVRKNWPLAWFEQVKQWLAERMPVYWNAGPEEELQEAVRFDSLWDLAEWLAGAELYIGNDSGITHLAAAAGIPVFAVFQASDPRVWAPPGNHVTVMERPSPGELIRTLEKANPHQDHS